jgi:tripartite-type tricarboxylate transporter receptor subunit TctC
MPSLSRRSALALAVAPGAFLAAVANARPMPFPDHPIHFIVPFPAGGSVDPLARIISQKMGADFGQQVIVENRPGGNTVIGTDYVARAKGDGYTILMTATSHVTFPLVMPVPYDPIKDFTPVTTLSSSDMVLAVHPSVPANSVQELIALAKAQPGVLNCATSGPGNPNDIASVMFNKMAGVNIARVPYKGAAPAVIDLMGGQVQMHFASPIAVLQQVAAGKLRAIAVSGPTRMAALPQVPTVAETLPGYEMKFWFGVLAPAHTPREVVAKLSNEITHIMAMPDVREKLVAAGMEPYSISTDQFAALLKSDAAKFAKIVKDADVRMQ